MKTGFALIVAFTLSLSAAQAQPSDAEGQQACGNDVFTLCQAAIPDRGRIEVCLRRNIKKVSADCRHFMTSYGRDHTRTTHHRKSHRHHYSSRSHHHSSHKSHYHRYPFNSH